MNFNQNDPLYKSVMLGFSKKYSLFSDGCYVISLAYVLGIDPIECNEKLKSVNAFMANSEGDLCLLDHTKIALAFPDKVSSVSKYDTYDNDACLEAIANNGKCIVKVDYDGTNSTQFDTHFVTFIGNKTLFDSLGGKEKPTSTYPILKGLRVINLKKSELVYKGQDLTNVEAMKVCVDIRDDLMNGRLKTLAEYEQLQKQITDLQKSHEDLDKRLQNLESVLQDKDKIIDSITHELRVLKVERQTCEEQLNYYKPYKSRYEEALNKIPNSLTGWDLITEGIKKLLKKI